MVFLVDPVEIRAMQSPVSPKEQSIFHQDKEYKLPEDCDEIRPVLDRCFDFDLAIDVMTGEHQQISHNQVIKQDEKERLGQDFQPLLFVLFPWPKFLIP